MTGDEERRSGGVGKINTQLTMISDLKCSVKNEMKQITKEK